MTPRRTALLAAIAGTPLFASAAPPPVNLEFVHPETKAAQPPWQKEFGWPLSLRITWSGALGIYDLDGGIHDGPLSQAFVVFSDPSACFDSLLGEFDGTRLCLRTPPLETYLEFTADSDFRGVIDNHGNDLLVESSNSPGVKFSALLLDGNTYLENAGPTIDSAAKDGIGYGPSDDLPGLVLLSDTGVGVVLDDSFDRPAIVERRNLAGLLEWTGFELGAGKSGSLSTGMQFPLGLLAQVIVADGAIGDSQGGSYNGGVRYRVDGGPVMRDSTPSASISFVYDALVESSVYELRAFLVSGTAPAILPDVNGDGRVDATDAGLMNYTVLSNEVSLRIRMVPEWICDYNVITRDLDGNGSAGDCNDGEIGPGRITRPPR